MAQNRGRQPPPAKIFLREHWTIRSSALVKEKGDLLSLPGFQTRDWYPARVPSTVAGTLVDDKMYPDPFVGMNLRMMPGCSYPIGANFSLRPMPEDSPFRASWWYRTEFRLPASYCDRNIWLHFDGINFRANIWLNGKQIGTSDQIAGTFRLRAKHPRCGPRGRTQYLGSRGVPGFARRSRLDLGRLESHAPGQKHGHLP